MTMEHSIGNGGSPVEENPDDSVACLHIILHRDGLLTTEGFGDVSHQLALVMLVNSRDTLIRQQAQAEPTPEGFGW